MSLRQAYPDEILYGSCKVSSASIPAPPPISFSADDSRVEVLTSEEVDESSDDEDTATGPAQPTSVKTAVGVSQQAADDDAETAEGAEAADALSIFLDGTEPHKASAHQLFHFAQNIVPHSWGCLKFDLSKPLLNLMSVLFARTSC